MEIIKRGVDPKTLPIDLECGNCGTVIRVNCTELREDPRERIRYYPQCPVCGMSILESAKYNPPVYSRKDG